MQNGTEEWLLECLSRQNQLQEMQLAGWSQILPTSPSLLCVSSPQYSTFLLNATGASYTLDSVPPTLVEKLSTHSSMGDPFHQLATQDESQLHGIYLPMPQSKEEDTMTIRFWSSLSPSHPQIQNHRHQTEDRGSSAFRPYNSALASITQTRPSSHGQNRIKSLFALLRTIRPQENPPISHQLHHMISERKRREKLNQNFHSLKALLPPGTKKDKASILSTTGEYLSSLKAQVAALQKKNMSLMELLLHNEREAQEEEEEEEEEEEDEDGGDKRAMVKVTETALETLSQERTVKVCVKMGVENSNMMNLTLLLLNFLRQMEDASLESIFADTHWQQMNLYNRVVLTLKIKKTIGWNQESFKEAVASLVGDVQALVDQELP